MLPRPHAAASSSAATPPPPPRLTAAATISSSTAIRAVRVGLEPAPRHGRVAHRALRYALVLRRRPGALIVHSLPAMRLAAAAGTPRRACHCCPAAAASPPLTATHRRRRRLPATRRTTRSAGFGTSFSRRCCSPVVRHPRSKKMNHSTLVAQLRERGGVGPPGWQSRVQSRTPCRHR